MGENHETLGGETGGEILRRLREELGDVHLTTSMHEVRLIAHRKALQDAEAIAKDIAGITAPREAGEEPVSIGDDSADDVRAFAEEEIKKEEALIAGLDERRRKLEAQVSALLSSAPAPDNGN